MTESKVFHCKVVSFEACCLVKKSLYDIRMDHGSAKHFQCWFFLSFCLLIIIVIIIFIVVSKKFCHCVLRYKLFSDTQCVFILNLLRSYQAYFEIVPYILRFVELYEENFFLNLCTHTHTHKISKCMTSFIFFLLPLLIYSGKAQ